MRSPRPQAQSVQVPVDMKRYPANWWEFSREIRFGRAQGRCECEGECGLHDGRDLFFPKAKRCDERHDTPAKYAAGVIVLTVAHLNRKDGICRCDPICSISIHVKAMCQRCHNRYDQPMRQEHAKATRQRKVSK